jgi:adenosylmethionine-8-amino-7-oxononanoate aminotransferase
MKSQFVFQRNSRTDLPVARAGEGCFLFDQTGNAYLDGSGGAAVSCLGHSDLHVKNAIIKQAENIAYAHTSFFTSSPAEDLSGTFGRICAGEYQ